MIMVVGYIKRILFSYLWNAHQPALGIARFANVLLPHHMVLQGQDGLQGTRALTDQALEPRLSASLLLVRQTELPGDPPVSLLEAEEVFWWLYEIGIVRCVFHLWEIKTCLMANIILHNIHFTCTIPSISTKMPEAGLTTPSNLAELRAIIHCDSGLL